jgi:hypothetical protein
MNLIYLVVWRKTRILIALYYVDDANLIEGKAHPDIKSLL